MKKENLFLLGSLGVNLLLIGMVVAPLVMHPPFHPPRPEMMMEHMASQLGADDAAKLRAIFAANKDKFTAHHEAVEKAIAHLGAAVSEDKPDMAQVDAALDEMRAANGDMSNAIAAIIHSAATDLSPEARRTLVKSSRHGHGPFGGPPHDGPDHEGPPGPPPLP